MFLPIQKKKNKYLQVSKNIEIFPDVEYSVSLTRVKNQLQILCIVSYTKMTNLIKFEDSKIYLLRSTFFIFCVARNTKYLELIFCMVVGYTIVYIHDFFNIF